MIKRLLAIGVTSVTVAAAANAVTITDARPLTAVNMRHLLSYVFAVQN